MSSLRKCIGAPFFAVVILLLIVGAVFYVIYALITGAED